MIDPQIVLLGFLSMYAGIIIGRQWDKKKHKRQLEFQATLHSLEIKALNILVEAKLKVAKPKVNPKYDHGDYVAIGNAMVILGGSFVHALGKALQHADNYNRVKLALAFPVYFKDYHEKATT